MTSQNESALADLAAIRANYSLTDEQRQIVDHVDRVSREVLHPLQARMDAEEWWPDDLFKQTATRCSIMNTGCPPAGNPPSWAAPPSAILRKRANGRGEENKNQTRV